MDLHIEGFGYVEVTWEELEKGLERFYHLPKDTLMGLVVGGTAFFLRRKPVPEWAKNLNKVQLVAILVDGKYPI